MKTAVIHFTPVTNSMIASGRIAKYIAQRLQCDLFDNVGFVGGSYDRFIIVNSPSAFCTFLNQLAAYAETVETIWVMNDYTIYPPTQLRKTGITMECWSILNENPFPHRSTYANIGEVKHINWNGLTWDPQPLQPYQHEGLLYYGSFRLDRTTLFEKYFVATPYEVHISSPKKALTKFEDLTDHCCNYYPVFSNVITEIPKFQFSLHIEDKFNYKVPTSLPNRFYECVSAGVPILIDKNCTNNFDVEIHDDWVVDGQKDVLDRLPHWESIRNKQAEKWRKVNYRELLDNRFDEILGES